MSEIQIDPTIKVTFGFNRKLSLGNYNSADASAYASADIPVDADQQLYVEKLQQLAAAVKAVVFDELGIDTFIDDNGVLREANTPLATTERVEHAINRALPVAEASDSGVRIINYEKTSKQALPAWAVDAFGKNGVTEVWDNRDTATGNRPKFKESNESAKANGRAEPMAFWAPKN